MMTSFRGQAFESTKYSSINIDWSLSCFRRDGIELFGPRVKAVGVSLFYNYSTSIVQVKRLAKSRKARALGPRLNCCNPCSLFHWNVMGINT